MPLDPISYQKVLTLEHHQQMRQQADPPADEAIRQVVEQRGREEGKKLFDLLISNIRLPKDQLPAPLLTFIDSHEILPAWADPSKIQLAHDLFRDHGPKFLVFLYFKSLPTMYSCANGAQVLVQTGRLAHDAQSLETFSRRIAETGQFLIDVMTEGGMQKDGVGIDSTLRVRLIHAAIRSFIPSSQWNAEELGQPINQADMATTLMTFSVSMLEGMDILGIDESDERKEAYVHLWTVVGHLMGVAPDLLPPNAEQGKQYLHFTLEQESRSSEAGHLLTKALTSFVDGNLDMKILEDLPESLITLLVGKEMAGKIGIENKGCLGILLPTFLSKIFGLGEKLEDRFPQIRSVFDEISFALSKKMVAYFNKTKNAEFHIPRYLQREWGIEQ
jgi:hypothetical protein